jgi:hypothetical protein
LELKIKSLESLLDIGSKRILKTSKSLNVFGSTKQGDYDFLVRAEARIAEYDDLTLNKNFTPEQAYVEVIKKFKKEELPELHDLEQPKSVSINNIDEQLKARPKDMFNELRNDVAKAYAISKDINTYKDDLRKIDLIEDVYDTRLIIFENDKNKALGSVFKTKKEQN